MEATDQDVLSNLAGRSILITGATGFVGKALLEKILRCCLDVAQVFVLIRPNAAGTADDRLHNELLTSGIFDTLKALVNDPVEYSRIMSKVVAVAGDVSHPRTGLSDSSIESLQHVSIVFHCAASINFSERLDRAAQLNTKGAVEMYTIASTLPVLECYVHVSSAYVNCNQPSKSRIQEKLYPLPCSPYVLLDQIDAMNAQQLNDAPAHGFLGNYPNSYTLTKSMAEHLVHDLHSKNAPRFSLVICRPAIVGCAWKEPVPGWVDDISAAASIYAGVYIGVLTFLPGHNTQIFDVVPVDFVVNGMLLSAVSAMKTRQNFSVSHIGTSDVRPLRFGTVIEPAVIWGQLNPVFVSHPKFKFLPPSLYDARFLAQYKLPITILNLIAAFGPESSRANAVKLDRLVERLRSLTDTFRFFLESEWIFETPTLMNPIAAGNSFFYTNIGSIQWDQWSVLFPYGIAKYCLGEEFVPLESPPGHLWVTNTQLPVPVEDPTPPLLSTYFPDFDLVMGRFSAYPKSLKDSALVPGPKLTKKLMASKSIAQAISDEAKATNQPVQVVQLRAKSIIVKLAGTRRFPVLFGAALLVRKLFRALFDVLQVNESGIRALRSAAEAGNLVYLPTHRSYLDFIIISFVMYLYGLPIPFIAAGEDFLGVLLVRWLFRNSGAFFIRRSFADDNLYSAIFSEFIGEVLDHGESIEFFIEGTRSRSGKNLHPKYGMLQTVAKSVFNSQDKPRVVTLCPITINYEKVLEAGSYKDELIGQDKVPESLFNLLKSLPVLFSKLGRVSINICEDDMITLDSRYPGNAFSFGVPHPLTTVAESLIPSLGIMVSESLASNSECFGTHLVSAILLLYRRGIRRSVLVDHVGWLHGEIRKRGGHVVFYQGYSLSFLVDRAISLLHPAISVTSAKSQQEDMIIPEIFLNERNQLLLGHYRNALFSLFWEEAIWAAAFYSFGKLDTSVSKSALFNEADFLFKLFDNERVGPFVFQRSPEQSFALMMKSGIFSLSEDNVSLSSSGSGELLFSFLCSIVWPFLDCYYVSAVSLFCLQHSMDVEDVTLLQRAQSLATTLYNESMLTYFEACSIDTLRNALRSFVQLGVVEIHKTEVSIRTRGINKRKPRSTQLRNMARLCQEYSHGDQRLQELFTRIDTFRKPSLVKNKSSRRAMIANLPILAKI